jgi:hypothetical protein
MASVLAVEGQVINLGAMIRPSRRRAPSSKVVQKLRPASQCAAHMASFVFGVAVVPNSHYLKRSASKGVQ